MEGSIIEGSVHLWIADLRKWRSHAQHLEPLLSDDEVRRLDRLKIANKKEDFLCSRGLLRLILSKYLVKEPEGLQFMYTPAGKPFLQDTDVQFNISHSKDFFICGISISGRIGVDIQDIYSISSTDWIIDNYFSAEEEVYLRSIQPKDIFQKHFFAIWTAKEAYLKAAGLGIRESFNQFSLVPEAEDLQTFKLNLIGSKGKGMKWTLRTIEVAQGYSSALAHDGPISEMRQLELLPDDFMIPKTGMA